MGCQKFCFMGTLNLIDCACYDGHPNKRILAKHTTFSWASYQNICAYLFNNVSLMIMDMMRDAVCMTFEVWGHCGLWKFWVQVSFPIINFWYSLKWETIHSKDSKNYQRKTKHSCIHIWNPSTCSPKLMEAMGSTICSFKIYIEFKIQF